MNTDHPFTTHGDEALEARIVAWVLGEASAFEAAELERLCDERPELMVFKRRIAALHEMLHEAENPQADESWKLPPEKRQAVEDVSCEKQVEELQQARERRVKRSGRRALFAIAAALVLLAVLAGLLAPAGVRMRKKSDLAVARQNELQRQLADAEMAEDVEMELAALDADKLTQRHSFAGEMAKSSEVSSAPQPMAAPARLRANKPGKSSAPPASRTAAVIAANTASSVPVPEIDGFINHGSPIQEKPADDYWDTSKVAAATIAKDKKREIHVGYKNEYLFRGVDLADTSSVDDLAKAVRDQENKVEERREALATIVRTKGIIYKGSGEKKDQSREEAIQRGLDAQDYIDAKREFETDQALLAAMKQKLAEELAKNAPPRAESQITPAWKFDEKMAAEEPYSTFSLNISDASFRIAQAALAKGEQPDPAGIKVEQFYNAVDYGDAAPTSGEPVACAIEQAAHPVIPSRNLVRIALKTAAAGRSAAQPLRITLLVDQSGSMTRADRHAAMDQALGGLAGLLTKDDLVNVIGFSRTPRLLADGMPGDQAGKLADLVNQSASEGGTNLEEAMKLANQLALRHQQLGAQNRIVLFTDGAANLGDADPARLAEKVKELRQQGIAFDIAGIAPDDLNDALLGELARNGNGRYYVVGKDADDNFANQLAGAFRPAAENVKVQVRFNPERVARYKLIGFEKDRLNTEDFRNDKVDAAELAAEEAGVAIYQVEPLPDGNGEIGEVSVRFRDTTANQMVERTWTIPHEPAAPALDRATPSMQLATLSMLAAEKLKGGPLGQAVDFKQLAAAQAEVKAFYSGNARVSELLQMIELLKQ